MTMKRMNLKVLLFAAITFASIGTANAQNTQNIDITAIVPSICIVDVSSETTMTFDMSNLGVAGNVLDFDALTTLAWRCSAGFNTIITIGPGGSADQTARELDDGGTPLSYNLYTTNLRTVVWGDGAGGTGTVAANGAGMAVANIGTSEVFGRIPLAAAEAAPPGTYTDQVLVTVVF
jgi:spore coat protein U-like protein